MICDVRFILSLEHDDDEYYDEDADAGGCSCVARFSSGGGGGGGKLRVDATLSNSVILSRISYCSVMLMLCVKLEVVAPSHFSSIAHKTSSFCYYIV